MLKTDDSFSVTAEKCGYVQVSNIKFDVISLVLMPSSPKICLMAVISAV